jgi:hypothetical protein
VNFVGFGGDFAMSRLTSPDFIRPLGYLRLLLRMITSTTKM